MPDTRSNGMFGAWERAWKPGQTSHAQAVSANSCGATETVKAPPSALTDTRRLPSGSARTEAVALAPVDTAPSFSRELETEVEGPPPSRPAPSRGWRLPSCRSQLGRMHPLDSLVVGGGSKTPHTSEGF